MDGAAFNYGILEVTAHRPWPMPTAPWIMTQSWHDLLFAHWPVDVSAIRALVPDALDLDLHEGVAWLAIVPFHMTNVAPRGVPNLPWVSAFPELNVRTYVRVREQPGVYFFSLDAGNRLVAAAARTLFHLPYYSADMSITRHGDRITYDSRRDTTVGTAAAVFRASYESAGEPSVAREGSLEHFLVERYCLFTLDAGEHVCRVDIHHPPWELQAARLTIHENTMAAAAGLRLHAVEPLLHFSKRQDVVAWPLNRV